MTRISVATPSQARCGIADYARHLAAAVPERHEVRMINLPSPGSASRSWRGAAALADSSDVVHLHYEYSLFAPVKPYRNRFATFMRRLRPPAVVTLHELLPPLTPRWSHNPPYNMRDLLRDVLYLPAFRDWEKQQYARAAHWIVHSREHEKVATERSQRELVSRWLHPILDTRTRWQENYGSAHVRLISPGFIKQHKGYQRFLSTLEQLPEAAWTLAGGAQDAPDRLFLNHLNADIDRLELRSRVNVTGYLSSRELESLTAAATLAVFPFDRVTASSSVAWAIALGMPIVTTDLPPLRELVQQGAGIELLPLEEPAVWAEKIQQLSASPKRLAGLAAANRSFAKAHSYAKAGEWLGELFDVLSNRRN